MKEFISIVNELIKLFSHLCEVEQKKLHTVEKNRVTLLEDCMNEEQAAILKLRGLDNRREKCMQNLGLEGATFQQILERVSDEDREHLQPLFHELSEKVRQFQELSDSAKAMIEINLHHINQVIAANQSEISVSSSITNKKV